MQHYLVHCLIMLCFTTAIAFGGFASRLKRSVQDKNSSLFSCASAFKICDGNEHCSEAFSKLEERCTVTDNSCNAKMKDLTRCGQIMDHLFAYGLPKEGCKCTDGNPECLGKQKKIYGNQCFVAIRHLRKHGLFPEKLDAYDKVTKAVTTTAVTSSGISKIHQSDIVSEDAQRFTVAKAKISTIDEETAASPVRSQNMQDSSVRMSIGKAKSNGDVSKLLQPQDGVNVIKIDDRDKTIEISIPPSERLVPSTQNIHVNLRHKSPHDANTGSGVDVKSTSAFGSNRGLHERLQMNQAEAVQRKISIELARQKKLEKNHNNTDYKSIAIILGILLAIVVLSSLIVFLWTSWSQRGNPTL